MPLDLDSFHTFSEDVGEDDGASSGAGENGQVLLQQSVTMLAYMDRSPHNSTVTSTIAEPQKMLGFSVHDLPILIGAAVGAVGLIIIILTAIIIWHCCKLRVHSDKAYRLDNSIPDDTFLKQNGGNMVQSESVVFLGSKSNQVSTRAIPIPTNILQSGLSRSQSASFREPKEHTVCLENEKKISKKRPSSQPVPESSLFVPALFSAKRGQPIHTQQGRNTFDDVENACTMGLPSIPEVLKSSEALHGTAQAPSNLYASCNALDGTYAYSSLYSTLDSNINMKTRSLPSWGRSRARPLSTEDDLNELYAKVSFSKKRKNRMRSDSAAAIAANKSKGAYMAMSYAHKDTDSLVDNEAVVVYDERTAL